MMEELSLNILDIVQNSIEAEGTKIEIGIEEDDAADRMVIRIKDNGRGMSPQLLAQVEDPFVTGRTTRKVGLGISFFKEAAETAGGSFHIGSQLGKGTWVTAEFQKSHIDRQPLGDVAGTLTSLILLNPDIDFFLNYRVNDDTFDFSTEEIREQLGGGIKLSHPDVISFISEYLSEHLRALNGGVGI